MKCSVCGAAVYKGESTVIAAVTGNVCAACAESILDETESNRVVREMQAFLKQVNAAVGADEFLNHSTDFL